MRTGLFKSRVVHLLAVLGLGLILGVTAFALADGGGKSKVHACVKAKAPNMGAVRIVGANVQCRDNERSIHWNKKGRPGPAGTSAVTQFAEFFALMPPDNTSTVAAGEAVDFPQNGPKTSSIARTTASSFELSTTGTYRVSFVVSVNEPGQLMLRLNGTDLPYTVAGRATGTSQIVGESLVTTTVANSTLEVINPSGNSPALTITPLAGGSRAVSASLVIQQLK